jgi:hypothetical protein
MAIALVAWPAAAQACAACATSNERNRAAFFITTIVLSLLPLAMIAIGAMALRRRLSGEFVEHDAWTPPAG